MPEAKEHPNLYGEDDDEDDVSEDDDDDDELEEEAAAEAVPKPQNRKAEAVQEEQDDLNSPSPSTSSSSDDNDCETPTIPNLSTNTPAPAPVPAPVPSNPPPSYSTSAALAPSFPDHKRQRISIEDSRRLFQRLWTDEDEILLLQGFLDYTSKRHSAGGRGPNYDTTPFYEQMKTRFQLDFNKNQLVEKLRRLKKKYRNILNRIGSNKDFSFRSPHEQATFEISCKIWSTAASVSVIDDYDDRNSLANASANKIPSSRRRCHKRSTDEAAAQAAKEENISNLPSTTTPAAATMSIPNVIEDTVKSCLSPLFKELLYCAINGPCNSAIGGVALNPLPLNFKFGASPGNLSSSDAVDERWRNQQILELEVYSKRLELVQEQINLALEELRSMES